MQTISLAESEWYSETGSFFVNSEDEPVIQHNTSLEDIKYNTF